MTRHDGKEGAAGLHDVLSLVWFRCYDKWISTASSFLAFSFSRLSGGQLMIVLRCIRDDRPQEGGRRDYGTFIVIEPCQPLYITRYCLLLGIIPHNGVPTENTDANFRIQEDQI